MSHPGVPPSREVLAENVNRCTCISCTMYRHVRKIADEGSPTARYKLFGALNAMETILAEAITKDMAP